MTDEEDTAILLAGCEVTSSKKEIKIVPMDSLPMNSPRTKINSARVIRVASFVTFLAGMVFGYDMTMIFNNIQVLAKQYNLECSFIYLLFAIWMIGGVLSVFASSFIDMSGRQWGMFFASIIIIVGSLLMVFAPCVSLVFTGRLLLGFGCTLSAVSQCVYIAETSEPSSRGFGITLHQFGITCGTFVSLIMGYVLKQNEYGWRIAIALNILPVVLIIILVRLYLPCYTPLRRRTSRFWRKLTPLSQNAILESSFLLISLVFILPWAGRISILNYGPLFFVKLGIEVKEAAYCTSLAFAGVRMVCTGISLYIVEHLGRRATLIMSIFIMVISTGFVGILTNNDIDRYVASGPGDPCPGDFMVDSNGVLPVYGIPESFKNAQSISGLPAVNIQDSPPPFPLLPTPVSLIGVQPANNMDNPSMAINVLAIVGLLVFESAHALGPDAVIWILGCELFPTAFRARCLTELFMVKWIIDILICAIRLYWIDFIDTGLSLFAHCLPLSMLLFFVFFFVPETTGKSLDEIDFELESNSLGIRICKNAITLPWFNKNRWLRRMAAHRRAAVRPQMQRTVI